MTRDDIIRIAEENGIVIIGEAMFRFAALVAAHEREMCARICDEHDTGRSDNYAILCAAAIRARGEE